MPSRQAWRNYYRQSIAWKRKCSLIATRTHLSPHPPPPRPRPDCRQDMYLGRRAEEEAEAEEGQGGGGNDWAVPADELQVLQLAVAGCRRLAVEGRVGRPQRGGGVAGSSSYVCAAVPCRGMEARASPCIIQVPNAQGRARPLHPPAVLPGPAVCTIFIHNLVPTIKSGPLVP